MHHNNRIKIKITGHLNRYRKTVYEIQQITQNKLGITKSMHDKSITNIIQNGQKLTAFALKFLTRQGYPFSLDSFHIVLGVLVKAIMKEQKVKAMEIGKNSKFPCLQITWFYKQNLSLQLKTLKIDVSIFKISINSVTFLFTYYEFLRKNFLLKVLISFMD
jgi:hypothetical protein